MCSDFQSDGYPAFGTSYWLHMCNWTEVSGVWQEFFYELDGDTTSTMERFDWVARAADPPPAWAPLINAVVDTLRERGADLISRSSYEKTFLARLDWRGSGISVELYFEPSNPSIRRLTVSRLSPRLLAALKSGDLLEADDSRNDSIPGPSREVLTRELRTEWPALADAFERGPKVLPSDIPEILRTILEATARSTDPDRRDLALFGANIWSGIFADQRTEGDSADVREFNQALGPFGAHIEGSQDWWIYNDGFAASLPERAGESSRWADVEFLRRMWTGGFGDPQGWVENQGLLATIEEGERFLRSHPSSPIAGDVKRMVAQAHETAWCVAQSTLSEDPSWPVGEIRARGAEHRREALRLYGEYLRERPDDPRNVAIRKRVRRMNLGIDTAYYKYWFSGD